MRPKCIVVFIKPDATIRKYVGARTLKEITKLIDKKDIIGAYWTRPTPSVIKKHYSHKAGEWFFDNLVRFISLNKILLLFIKYDEKYISNLRELIGSTLVERAEPTSIRGRYGLFRGINIIHVTDSADASVKECQLWSDFISRYKDLNISISINELNSYINKYIDMPLIDNIRYKEVIKDYVRNLINKDTLYEKFIKLISKETDEDHATIEKFVSFIVSDIDLALLNVKDYIFKYY